MDPLDPKDIQQKLVTFEQNLNEECYTYGWGRGLRCALNLYSDNLNLEEENDKLLTDPDYYYPHPQNTSTVLYDKKLNQKILKSKEIKSNIEKEIFKGEGIHPLSTKN